MKKICLIILFLSMIWLVPAGALAAEGADVEVSVAWAEAQKGDEVELAITVNSEKKIQGATFYLDYDEGQLELLGALEKYDANLAESIIVSEVEDAILSTNTETKKVGYIRLRAIAIQNRVLLTVRFRVLSVNPGDIAIVDIVNPDFGDLFENTLSVAVTYGGVMVSESKQPDESRPADETTAESRTTESTPAEIGFTENPIVASQLAENSMVQSQITESEAQASHHVEITTAESQSVQNSEVQSWPASSAPQDSQSDESSDVQSQPATSTSQESQTTESNEIQSQPATSTSQESQTTESNEIQSQPAANTSQESQVLEQATEENHSAENSIGESASEALLARENTTVIVPPANNSSHPSEGGSGKMLLIGGVSVLVIVCALVIGKKTFHR